MSESAGNRGQVRFREREAARLARAIRQAGGGKMTLDPRTGMYSVVIGPGDEEADTAENEWDGMLNK